MKTTISPHDWQLLSDYLDNQLSPGKRVRLEARLQTKPELRAALEDLRRNQTMLRNLPRLKAPRTFRLTPNMVGVRPTARLFPAFQFASALASLLLVVALVGDFLNMRPGAPAAMSEPYPLAQEVYGEPPPEAAMEKATEEELPSIAAEAPSAETFAVETATAAAAPEGQDLSDQEMPEAAMRSATTPEAAGGPAATTLAVEEEQPGFVLTSWQWTEILLAVTALLTGLIAFTLRSRGV